MSSNDSREAMDFENMTELFDELNKINQFWGTIEPIYKPLELIIYAIGLCGNFLALITLMRSKKMRTPSFAYHRALVTADFFTCANYLINQAITRLLVVECSRSDKVFKYWFPAFFNGVVNPVISSVCTYVLHYATLVIALDRVLALLFAVGYHRWNQPKVARMVIVSAVLISASVHSWSAFMQMEVSVYHKGESNEDMTHQLLVHSPCWNDSVVYYPMKGNFSNSTKEAIKTKEIYNSISRMVYAVVLALLTLGVIAGLIRRRKRREAGRSMVSLQSIASTDPTSYVDQRRKGSNESNASRRSELPTNNRQRRNRGCERALFVLMIAVLILAFLQVAASETQRFFEFMYPRRMDTLEVWLFDPEIDHRDKLWYLKLSMYGSFILRVIASIVTALERSFVCILYMAMNALFRRELLAMLNLLFLRGRLCKPCQRQFRLKIVGPKRPQPPGTEVTNGHGEGSRFIVADVEPTSGCHFRTAALSQSSGKML